MSGGMPEDDYLRLITANRIAFTASVGLAQLIRRRLRRRPDVGMERKRMPESGCSAACNRRVTSCGGGSHRKCCRRDVVGHLNECHGVVGTPLLCDRIPLGESFEIG